MPESRWWRWWGWKWRLRWKWSVSGEAEMGRRRFACIRIWKGEWQKSTEIESIQSGGWLAERRQARGWLNCYNDVSIECDSVGKWTWSKEEVSSRTSVKADRWVITGHLRMSLIRKNGVSSHPYSCRIHDKGALKLFWQHVVVQYLAKFFLIFLPC